MTAQEGAFWLRAGLLDQITRPVAAAERALAEGELSADDAYELAVHTQLPYGEAMSALVAVLDPAEIAARLAGPPPPKPSWSPYGRDMGHFTAGVRLHLVPRLADADRERLAEAAAAALRSDLSRPDKLFAASAVLAAQLGCSEEVAEFVSRWPDGWFGQGGGGGYETIAIGLGSREAFWAETRRTTMSPAMAHSVPGWLAQSELDDLAGFERALSAREGRMAVLFAAFAARVHAPEAAPMMVRLLRSRVSKLALEWLYAHPEAAAAGLGRSPDAVAMLRRLGLEQSPYEALPVRALGLPRPKRAPSAAGLPPLVVDGARLAQEDVEAVLAALAKDEPLPVELDPEAAEEFAWELFERWMFEGGPPKEKWRMLALGRLGRDGSAMRLAPLIRAWPGESQHKRAVLGLDVLRAIGTDTALMQLNGIAQKLKYKALQERARMAIAEIAEELGLTREELEDRIVPDCGLDADGQPHLRLRAAHVRVRARVRHEAQGARRGRPGARLTPEAGRARHVRCSGRRRVEARAQAGGRGRQAPGRAPGAGDDRAPAVGAGGLRGVRGRASADAVARAAAALDVRERDVPRDGGGRLRRFPRRAGGRAPSRCGSRIRSSSARRSGPRGASWSATTSSCRRSRSSGARSMTCPSARSASPGARRSRCG